MNIAELRELIKQDIPQLVREDSEIQELILRLSRRELAPKQQTEDRIERILARVERDREALASVLEKSFDVHVVNVNEYDDQGKVFGRPDQVELDVIFTDGTLILMEPKSSFDKSGMYSFERKARFYEKRHNCKATRLMVVSPIIDPKARQVGERLDIEMFGDTVLVESL